MDIGVLKEVKEDEKRVSLLPEQVSVLVSSGHHVSVEQGAGLGSGISNGEYESSGAVILDKQDVLRKSQLLLKVKAPIPNEYEDYNEAHTLFTYLHFDENISVEQISSLIRQGFLGIAYEWVGEEQHYPILKPMSQLTGYLFAKEACHLCARYKGIFCGGNEDFLPAAHAMVIGLGNIGLSALKYFIDNGLKVTVVDSANRKTVNAKANIRFGTANVDYVSAFGVDYIQMDIDDPERTKKSISDRMKNLDIVICSAVRRENLPKRKLEYLIDKEMVSQMSPNSVICDATANDKDLIETCISSASLYHTYEVNDVIHYNCDHIPSMTPKTASKLLTNESFKYILQMANTGVIESVSENQFLRNGVSCFKGYLTHKYSANKKGLSWKPIQTLCGHVSVEV